ncbi:hypothetical protein RUND412_006979 [Rhizina undulata]
MESPQLSPVSSPKSRSRASSRGSHLTLDLSSLPQPATPTNTLLITNLLNPEIFHPAYLQDLRDIINTSAPIATWSPLKSFRRIVCSFNNTEDAITVRQAMDGEGIMGERIRVYFGEHTPLQPTDQHLQAPESKKLFFISPPPSPPHGWEMRNEEPPNSVVVAEDLAHALAKLSCNRKSQADEEVPTLTAKENNNMNETGGIRRARSSSSVVLFEPEENGKEMPAISVDDYTDSGDERSPVTPVHPASFHTSRPPVELMHDA